MKRKIIFDFGGVLMKTTDYTPRHTWDEKLGLPQGSVERAIHNSDNWIKAQSGVISPDEYWADVADKLNLSPAEVRQLAADFYSGDQLDMELIDYIRQLRQNGHTVTLLSNDTIELTTKLQKLNIDHLFDPIIISAEIGVMKPNAEAYQAMLKELGCLPDEAVFIDDRLENIEGANAVGIHGIHYVANMSLPAAISNLLDA